MTESQKKEKNAAAEQRKTSKKKNNGHKPLSKPSSPTFAYTQQPVIEYQLPSVVVNQQVPFTFHDVNKPPPKLPGIKGSHSLQVAQSPTVQQSNAQNYPFHWSHPTSRWKYLPQVELT